MLKNRKVLSKFSALLLTLFLVTLLSNCKKEVAVKEEIPVPPSNGEVYDADGNKYFTVIIGNAEWFTSNLNTTRFSDGTLIPKIMDNTAWSNLSSPGYCEYNISRNGLTYGKLYNWYTIESNKNPCPYGWRVPTDDQWNSMLAFNGGDIGAGGALKQTGTDFWRSPNKAATNLSGFTALPGGWRAENGEFLENGEIGAWWSLTEASKLLQTSWSVTVFYDKGSVLKIADKKAAGLSVRCARGLSNF